MNVLVSLRRVVALILAMLPFFAARAQQSRLLAANPDAAGRILTLRTEQGGRLVPLPILQLGGGDAQVAVSFDEMSHDYHRYVYRLEHCDVNWQTTASLFYTEYANITQEDVPIEDYTESRNVTTHYTHYSFDFPNPDMRPTLSGNYRLTILCDDDDPIPVAEVCFCVVEPLVGVQAGLTTDTEVDIHASHQQVTFAVDCTALPARDLRDEVTTLVIQNGRLDNAVMGAPPSYVNGQRLIWDHQRELVFDAGNEYRKYEILSERYPGLHTEHIRYHDPFLHATLMTDEPRRNYLASEDQNGLNVIRNTDNFDDATETEYMITHFALALPEPLPDADVYLNAQWTTGGLCPAWQLHYDEASQAYLGAFMLKQGYYNYQYLVVPRTSRRGTLRGCTAPIEGNYYQTSNDYTILVYYHQPGARYTRLVGAASVSS